MYQPFHRTRDAENQRTLEHPYGSLEYPEVSDCNKMVLRAARFALRFPAKGKLFMFDVLLRFMYFIETKLLVYLDGQDMK